MRRVLITIFASLLAVALIAPGAQGATMVRHFQFEVPAQGGSPTPAGRITLDFAFKNKRGNKEWFTPRQLTRIDLESVPLFCFNAPVNPTGTSELLLTTTLETKVKLRKSPPHTGAKPKVGKRRYAFTFVYSFPAFTGTISGKIDKVNGRGKTRAHGSFTIEDLDSDPGHWDCSTFGRRGWSVPSPCRTPSEGGSLPICLEAAGLRE